ncbi:MAG: hypothetical protein KKA19_05540 [Candidatus Margulisbacteria bacterium]|nr:hypothetical protein [Candidatus Margulisiibacteriota bacterium]
MQQTHLKPKVVVEGVKEIEKYLPHRFENVLLDKVEAFEDNEEKLLAKIELTITENDPEGRNIFLIKNQENKWVYNAHMFPENLALGALVYLNTIRGDGHGAYFSTISNFQKTGDVLASEKLQATIHLKRGKGSFQTFSGKVYNPQGALVAETEVMAFIFKLAEAPAAGEGEKKKSDPPQKTIEQAVDFSKIDNKQKNMFFAEKIVHFNPEDNSAVISFTYPKDHPFVKGHFPGNPIMMGVCQWMAMGDALDALALELKAKGKVNTVFTLTADIELLKEDGVVAAEAKGFVKNYKVVGSGFKPRVVSTKKCGFRDMIVPGDVIYQKITNVQIS